MMEHERRTGQRPAHRSDTDPETQILIESGIEAARTSKRDIDPATARMIAHALATRPESPLARFAKTGEITNAEAREEYLPLYLGEDTPDDVHELIDWLGAYLIHQENPAPHRPDRFGPTPRLGNILWLNSRSIDNQYVDLYIPGDLPPDDDEAILARLAPLISAHGEPFLCFLEMNDVNAADPDIGASFEELYVGTFDSRDEVLHAMTEIDDMEHAIQEIAGRYAGGEFITLNRVQLWERVREVWEVIDAGEQYHVFNR